MLRRLATTVRRPAVESVGDRHVAPETLVGNTVLVMQSWTCRHFSQASPKGEGQSDVPPLLRPLADSIESKGTVSVQDIAFHTEERAAWVLGGSLASR